MAQPYPEREDLTGMGREALNAAYAAFLLAHGYPATSADELHLFLLISETASIEHINWLGDFGAAWEALED